MQDPIISQYPQLRTLRLAGEHQRFGSKNERRVTYDNNLPVRIPCSNPDCHAGGYYLGTILFKLTESFLTAYAGNWNCDGCENSLRFSLWLGYHERRSQDTSRDEKVSAAVFRLQKSFR
jgi:hypothetical protein